MWHNINQSIVDGAKERFHAIVIFEKIQFTLNPLKVIQTSRNRAKNEDWSMNEEGFFINKENLSAVD